jgi:hypothetical protein
MKNAKRRDILDGDEDKTLHELHLYLTSLLVVSANSYLFLSLFLFFPLLLSPSLSTSTVTKLNCDF